MEAKILKAEAVRQEGQIFDTEYKMNKPCIHDEQILVSPTLGELTGKMMCAPHWRAAIRVALKPDPLVQEDVESRSRLPCHEGNSGTTECDLSPTSRATPDHISSPDA